MRGKGAARPCSLNVAAAGPAGKVAGTVEEGLAARRRRPRQRPKEAAGMATAAEEAGAGEEAALTGTEEVGAGAGGSLEVALQLHRPPLSTVSG